MWSCISQSFIFLTCSSFACSLSLYLFYLPFSLFIACNECFDRVESQMKDGHTPICPWCNNPCPGNASEFAYHVIQFISICLTHTGFLLYSTEEFLHCNRNDASLFHARLCTLLSVRTDLRGALPLLPASFGMQGMLLLFLFFLQGGSGVKKNYCRKNYPILVAIGP